MSNLPSQRSAGPAIRTDAARPERRWALELTPAERVARRRNRRMLLAIAIPSVLILVLALIASGVAESNLPSGPRLKAPTGYQLARDGYFSYVVPHTWQINQLYTDNSGDVYRSGPGGWAGEHIAYRNSPPTLGEAQPASLAAFGVDRPQPYLLTGGHRITVRGATTAFSYALERSARSVATVVDAWDARSAVEIWLVVQASPPIADRLLGSLSA